MSRVRATWEAHTQWMCECALSRFLRNPGILRNNAGAARQVEPEPASNRCPGAINSRLLCASQVGRHKINFDFEPFSHSASEVTPHNCSKFR